MTEHNYIDDHPPIIRLRVWALGQMVWGAFLAGVGLAVVLGFLGAVWVVSQFLDGRSKTAPSPYGALEIVQTTELG